jgi:hypothetical protein
MTALNPSGSGLLFSTYLGGSGNDYAFGLALDAAGNAYVGGQTSSANFPTTAGAYQQTAGSGFVLEIDPPAESGPARHPPALGRSDGAWLFGLLDEWLAHHAARWL